MKVFSLSDYEQEISPQLLPERKGDAIDYLIYGKQFSDIIFDFQMAIPSTPLEKNIRIRFVKCSFGNDVFVKSQAQKLVFYFEDCFFDHVVTSAEASQDFLTGVKIFVARNCRFEQCRFHADNHANSDWCDFKMEKCVFEQCSFSGQCSYYVFCVRDCKFMGCQFKNIEYETCDVPEIIDCEVRSCTFRHLKIRGDLSLYVAGSCFSNCLLEDIEWHIEGFLECDFDNITIKDANLYQGYLKNSRLQNINILSVQMQSDLEGNITDNIISTDFCIET